MGGVKILYERICWGIRMPTFCCMQSLMLSASLRLAISASTFQTVIRPTKAPTVAYCCAALSRVRAAGWQVGNVDATIIAQAPKKMARILSRCGNIASDCAVVPDRIAVKATTTENALVYRRVKELPLRRGAANGRLTAPLRFRWRVSRYNRF